VENLRRLKEDYPRSQDHPADPELPFQPAHPARRQQRHRQQPAPARKNLWSELGLGDHVELVQCRDDRHEAETVASCAFPRTSSNARTRFADYAILYRGNHQARLFEEALREAKMPYQLSGGQSFFDKSEIKDLTPTCA
jgi:ATP-dependent DNA helicase Rep